MRYFINGRRVESHFARREAYEGYVNQGGDPAEFAIVWEGRDCPYTGEEKRELLNEWPGYTLEILTDSEDEELDD